MPSEWIFRVRMNRACSAASSSLKSARKPLSRVQNAAKLSCSQLSTGTLCVSRYSNVSPMSRMDFAPARTTAIEVFASSCKSATRVQDPRPCRCLPRCDSLKYATQGWSTSRALPRVGAYHCGTVWPRLQEPFVEAGLRTWRQASVPAPRAAWNPVSALVARRTVAHREDVERLMCTAHTALAMEKERHSRT